MPKHKVALELIREVVAQLRLQAQTLQENPAQQMPNMFMMISTEE